MLSSFPRILPQGGVPIGLDVVEVRNPTARGQKATPVALLVRRATQGVAVFTGDVTIALTPKGGQKGVLRVFSHVVEVRRATTHIRDTMMTVDQLHMMFIQKAVVLVDARICTIDSNHLDPHRAR